MLNLSGIYCIVDADACAAHGLDLVKLGEAFFDADVPIVQLRAKGFSAPETLTVLRRLVESPRRQGALVFANDRADLAELAGCDGVHLGQQDLPVGEVRKKYPGLSLGLSTHKKDEFLEALDLDLSYIALGPVFATASKKNPEPVVGFEELARLSPHARAKGVPLVAIGGIDDERLTLVGAHADAVAMIGALLPGAQEREPYGWVTERVRTLTKLLVSARDSGFSS